MNPKPLSLVIASLRRAVTLGSLFLSVSIASGTGLCQIAVEHPTQAALSNEIESLLRTEYTQDDDSVAVARVQKILTDDGFPTKEMVGTAAVQDFMVLLVNDQPFTFMKQASPSVKRAVDTGQISSNDGLYFRVSMNQKEVESRLGKPTNPELQKQIEAMTESDQAPRKKEAFDPKTMDEIDKQNRSAILSILDRYGVPTFAMVGSEAANDFVVLIQHQPPDFLERALPKLKQNVDTGQAEAKSYAMMFDRTQTYRGKPEMYGVNLICQANGIVSPGPLVDPEHVDERRAAIGLMPLKTYLHLAAIVTPPDFCKKASGS